MNDLIIIFLKKRFQLIRDVSMEASTRVVNFLIVDALTPVDRVRRDQPGALFHADRARHGPALVGFGD